MSKVKTKELLEDVSNHIKTKMDYDIVEDVFSDYEGKYLVSSPNPNFRNTNDTKNREFMFHYHITFSVFKNSKKEQFIIWDNRVNQPFFKSEFCVYKGSFGRYDFNNKEDFYKHIETDYGMDEFVEMRLNKKKELETNIN